MSVQNETRHAPCVNMRGKKMFYTEEGKEDIFSPNSYQDFWCTLTMTCDGPDAGFVEYRRCKPGRTCYKSLLDE